MKPAAPESPAASGGGSAVRRVAVIGGGISGLSAAWFLRGSSRPGASAPPEVTVFEAEDRLGGCLQATTLGGMLPLAVDAGAEAALARRPEAIALAGELGLEIQRPGTVSSRIFARGALHPIPPGNLMGVPSDPAAAAGLLAPAEVDRARHEEIAGPVTGDVSVGAWISARLGEAVADLLVDPLLGGVYAGDAWNLSLRATVPALWPVAREGRSLLEAAGSHARALADAARRAAESGRPPAPVFMGLTGGMAGLIGALESRLARGDGKAPPVGFRRGEGVLRLDRRPGEPGWFLTTSRGDRERFDAVIVALPAHRAAALLDAAASSAARGLREIDHASSAVVTALVGLGEEPLTGSGFLVPPSQTEIVKASTFSSNKWPWLGRRLPRGTAVLRASVGRFGAPGALGCDDDDLAAAALGDLERILGRRLPVLGFEVRRWDEALPQYSVGHTDRIAGIEKALEGAEGLAVTGAWSQGVGIPACIASAERAAARITREMGILER